jgi:hypothetical protein
MKMFLVSLYQAHAAMCSELAGRTRDAEIQNRWIELAGHWRQKAKACEELSAELPITPPSPPIVLPNIAVTPDVPSAPSLEPIVTQISIQPLAQPPLPSQPIEAYGPAIEDHHWRSLLEDIRGR